MKYKILSPSIHGLLDYAAAAGLIVLPFVLGLGETSPAALWLSVAGGIGHIAYSLALLPGHGSGRTCRRCTEQHK